MARCKDLVKNMVLTDEERARLSPEDLALIEQYLKELQADSSEPVVLVNEDRFDAKDMHPVGQGPVRWKVVDEEP